jgi:hypothetical protein
MGQPTVHLFGSLQTISTVDSGTPPTAGSLVIGAKVRVELSNYGPNIPQYAGTGGGTLAKGTDYASTPTPGNFSTYLFRNDQINPIGTFYTVFVEDEDGNVIQCGAYRFNADGDFNLATQVPIDGQDPPPPLPPTPPYSELLVMPYSNSLVFDGGAYSAFQITLSGNVTTATAGNMVEGNLYTITYLQDGVGNHTVVWPANIYNWADICSAPNSRSTQTFVADESDNLFAVSTSTWFL